MDIFVYGSLQHPEILGVVIGRVPAMTPATITNWFVSKIPDVDYPGLIPREGNVAQGHILHSISDQEMQALDSYEGDQYQRSMLTVSLDDGTTRELDVYVLADGSATGEQWLMKKDLVGQDLARQLRYCHKWRDGYDSQLTL